jgi:hypothetical protein
LVASQSELAKVLHPIERGFLSRPIFLHSYRRISPLLLATFERHFRALAGEL